MRARTPRYYFLITKTFSTTKHIYCLHFLFLLTPVWIFWSFLAVFVGHTCIKQLKINTCASSLSLTAMCHPLQIARSLSISVVKNSRNFPSRWRSAIVWHMCVQTSTRDIFSRHISIILRFKKVKSCFMVHDIFMAAAAAASLSSFRQRFLQDIHRANV